MVGRTIFDPFLIAKPAPVKWPRMLDAVPIRPSARKTLPARKARDERADVGRQIHELHVAARRAHVELAEIAEDEQQERAPVPGP